LLVGRSAESSVCRAPLGDVATRFNIDLDALAQFAGDSSE
jgi:hypothetical protein